MSPLRRHGGGRPRSAHSTLDFAERWGISEKAARRLASLNLSDEVMTLLARDSQRCAAAQLCAAAQRRETPGQGRPTGGMKKLGMASRVPAGRSNLVLADRSNLVLADRSNLVLAGRSNLVLCDRSNLLQAGDSPAGQL